MLAKPAPGAAPRSKGATALGSEGTQLTSPSPQTPIPCSDCSPSLRAATAKWTFLGKHVAPTQGPVSASSEALACPRRSDTHRPWWPQASPELTEAGSLRNPLPRPPVSQSGGLGSCPVGWTRAAWLMVGGPLFTKEGEWVQGLCLPWQAEPGPRGRLRLPAAHPQQPCCLLLNRAGPVQPCSERPGKGHLFAQVSLAPVLVIPGPEGPSSPVSSHTHPTPEGLVYMRRGLGL